MKTSFPFFPMLRLLLLSLLAIPVLQAEPAAPDAPVAPAAPEAPAAVAPAVPAEEKKPEAPAVEAAPAAGVAPAAPEAATKDEAASKEEKAEADDESEPEQKRDEKEARRWKKPMHGHHSGNERVGVGEDAILREGETADAVVSIFGSARSAGTVHDAVVSVLGSTTSSGKVGDAVVAVLGNNRVEGGRVGDAAVSVLGNNYINAEVGDAAVAILGNLELGPDAVINGDVVCIGGQVKQDPAAIIKGKIVNFPKGFDFDWLLAWFHECFLKARPLAFGANLMWAWWIALGCLGFYALLALLFPSGVERAALTLEQRPGYSLLAAVLTLLLTPIAYVLLSLTFALGIGFVLVPLFSFGMFFATLFGKAVMLLWIGRRFARLGGPGTVIQPALGVLAGGVLVLLLYTVPVVGFITYKLLSVLGLGVVMYTLLLSMKQAKPGPAPAMGVTAAPAAAPADVVGLPPVVAAAAGAALPPVVPPLISAVTLPRAGFLLRFAATLLDLILVALVFGILSSMLFGLGGGFPLWFAIYHVVMWATKGTTIGGIICGLKVVRIDARPMDWSVAIVRALGAFLSLAVAGLGFVWVAFDDEKQSWHDKIAGTTIVKVPKGVALL